MSSANPEPQFYQAFGLTISSCLPLPDLMPGEGEPDVTICYGTVPARIENAAGQGMCFQVTSTAFRFAVMGVATYLTTSDGQIVIERAPEATDDDVRGYLLGSVIGAMLHWRGIAPLHASAVEYDGEAALFAGQTGKGKSSLTGALVTRGHRMLADDICAIRQVEDGRPELLPAYPRLKLRQDTLDVLGHETDPQLRVGAEPAKFHVPTGESFRQSPLPLRHVYVLATTDEHTFELRRITGMAKVHMLLAQTYRRRFVNALGCKESHFRLCSAIAEQTLVTELIRPKDGFLLHELADRVEQDLSQ